MILLRVKQVFLLALVGTILVLDSSSFVVHPPISCHPTRHVATLLEQSAQGNDNTNPGPLKKAANAITAWFQRPEKTENTIVVDPYGGKLTNPTQHDHKLMEREMKNALKPLPWPFRALGMSMARSISRELITEEHKAKPLLQDAQQLIRKDPALMAVLGEPIQFGPIIFKSSSSASRTIHGKKMRHIEDRFGVFGSRQKGMAIVSADMYAKGHIQSLRVDVEGIHYDVDVRKNDSIL